MKEDFKHFNKHERKILKLLYNIRVKQSILSISKRLEMHWTTVEKSLKSLEKKGWVIKDSIGKEESKTIWGFNFEGYDKIKEKFEK